MCHCNKWCTTTEQGGGSWREGCLRVVWSSEQTRGDTSWWQKCTPDPISDWSMHHTSFLSSDLCQQNSKMFYCTVLFMLLFLIGLMLAALEVLLEYIQSNQSEFLCSANYFLEMEQQMWLSLWLWETKLVINMSKRSRCISVLIFFEKANFAI